jgi:RNA recognition motif-containing protein
MGSKLYVGNLSFSTTEDELRALFAQAGTVDSVALIKDRETGRSKGFAFVEMNTAAEAQKAISTFNNYALGERNIRVSEARPREEGAGGGYGRGGGGGGGYGRGTGTGGYGRPGGGNRTGHGGGHRM